MKTKTLGLLILAIVVVGAAALVAVTRPASNSESSGATGVIAPGEFSAASFGGKPVMLNFFFKDCPPCGEEAADLKAFVEANPGVQVVAVDVQDGEDDARAFLQEHGLEVPLVVDDGTLAGKYAIEYTPTSVFLDAAGNEADRLVGASTLDQFTASLAKAQ